jgi:twitching motility two-component system response regulator PilG
MSCSTKVMVIEDNGEILRTLSFLFKSEGYEVLEAQDGASALEQLLKLGDWERPSVIFLDLMMPKMDGLSFWMALQKDSSLSKIPVVVLSCSDPTPDKMEILGDKVAFLTKPVGIDVLLGYAKRHCATT